MSRILPKPPEVSFVPSHSFCRCTTFWRGTALANAYYPEEERGVGKTFSRVGMGIPFSVIDHLVDEFGPDLQRKLTHKRKQPEQ